MDVTQDPSPTIGGAARRARSLTLLHADSPVLLHRSAAASLWTALARLIASGPGEAEPCLPGTAIVSFGDPRDALRVALQLQRRLPELRLRVGLAGGAGPLAEPLSQRAERLAHSAGAGSIVLAPETYAAVGEGVAMDIGDCLLVKEFEADDQLLQVVVTPPPSGGAELSSFAGLGLL